MENLKQLQGKAKSLRDEKDQLSLQFNTAKAKLEKIESQIRDLKKRGLNDSDNRVAKLLHQQKTMVHEKKNLSSELKKNSDLFSSFNTHFNQNYDPVRDIEHLDDSYPILLFPLRIETRFKKTGNQNQLWIRVYPDDSNVVIKTPGFTEDELADIKIFWSEMAKAGSSDTEQRGAWNILAKGHGVNRALWMINNYQPLNGYTVENDDTYKILVLLDENENQVDLKPEAINYWKEIWKAQGNEAKIEQAKTKLKNLLTEDEYNYSINLSPYNIHDVLEDETAEDRLIISKINLPNAETIITTQSSWNEAPKAVVMPDKFVAITYANGNRNTHLFEKSVKNNLAVGIDPSLEKGEITKDLEGIHLNEDLKWMVDFDEAVKAGMATKINLSAQEAQNGFDQLFVFGLRASSDANTSKAELEELISTHQFSNQGFAFLKQGTPTNNTQDSPSGHSWSEDTDEYFDAFFKTNVSPKGNSHLDFQRFADSLNLNPKFLRIAPNANGTDQLEATAMNKALFPATLGYFLEEMMDPLFSDRDIKDARNFFTDYVSGRGPIPAIKIGTQPYGILPVTRFSNLRFSENFEFQNKLTKLLKKIDETWDTAIPEVSHIGKSGDPHQILLNVLGLHSNSVEFHQRYAQSIDQVYNQLKLTSKDRLHASEKTRNISRRGRQILSKLGLDPKLKLPILEKFFLSKPKQLEGPLVDDVPESETELIRKYTADGKNYIEWLQSSDGNKIRLQNFGGNPAPNALLYLLLRHSVLLSQANAGTNFLISKNLIASKKVFHDPPFLHIQKQEIGKSKFEHLYQANEKVTGNASTDLIDFIYDRNILETYEETAVLNEVLNALKILENTPTAKLQRLLIEHLDTCTYRIDSWKTGLTFQQLQVQKQSIKRQQKEEGIFLGAYGWLLELRPKNRTEKEKTLPQKDADFFAPNDEKISIDPTNLGYIHAPSVDQAATAAILRNAFDSNKDSGTKNPFAINLTSERVRIANDFLEGIRNGQSLGALLGYQFERGLHDRYQSSNIEADRFIYPLRMEFPLVSQHWKSSKATAEDLQEAEQTNNSETSIEAIEARNVIDGLQLIRHVQENSAKIYPFGKSKLPPANNVERDAITEEVNRLIDINDAIVDLLMAEQVYQTVKGNFDRSAAVANAYSKGNYPPEMEVVNTPRSGLNLNHKVAIHFDAEVNPLISPNSVAEMTPRATSEASVNLWLSDILPAPEKVLVKVKVIEPGKDEAFIFVSQKDLGLQPIDLLFSAILDSEQAMTELDDRITNYLLLQYKDTANNPLNQFTKIEILYTEEIDPNDKSKVSFFELGTTLSSLRKILVNRTYLNHASMQLPTENANTDDIRYDVDHFKNRIEKIKTDLETEKNRLTTLSKGVRSIQSLSEKHNDELGTLEENVKTQIIQFLSDSLKAYALNKTDASKDEIKANYENILDQNSVIDPLKSTLITQFEAHLINYATDLSNLSELIKNTCNYFMAIAFYDNNLTGTGFIHQATGVIFTQVVENVETVITRWNTKKTEYEEIMANFSTAATDEERSEILQKAERKISSTATFPVPSDVSIYEISVENKHTEFIKVLTDLKKISTSGQSDVFSFLSETNTILEKIADHDVVTYDTKNNRNELHEELKTILQLKENVYSAILNLIGYTEKKLAGYSELFATLVEQKSDNEKIELLLKAAKLVLKEEILMLPHLKLSASFGRMVQSAYNHHEDIQEFSRTNEERLFPVEDWLLGVARVRENMWHFENITSLVNGFKSGNSIDLKPLQFPIRSDARWLAMKFTAEDEDMEEYLKSLAGDSLLYTAHFAIDFDPAKTFCGIVVDEWTEVVPFKNETTGIAFHYDQPSSEPPQTMLLLTPSQLNGKWEWEDVIGAMEETLAMAKKRAVEPSMIDRSNLGQFLPTTLMAVSSNWITMALNLDLNNYAYQIER